jgi:hypothetical protein
VAIASIVTGIGSTVVYANTVTSTWNGTSGSNWNTATNWSPNGVPNNGTNSVSDYNVILGTSNTTTVLDINATIDSLTVNTGDQLTINGALTLNINGPTVTNNGTIQVDTYSSNANLNFTANTTISGTGTIFLYDNNPHPTLNSSGSAIVTLGSGQTIDGIGNVNATLVDSGIINANYGGQSLILQTNAKTNNNLFEATNGGTLIISGITVTQGTGGQILAGTSGAVSITGTTISGGTLNSGSGSVISVTSSTLNNVTIATGAQVQLTSGTNVNISGGSLVNNGLLQVDTYASNANLNFVANTNVSGTGRIFLDDNNPHPTLNSSTGSTVTFSAGQVVDGSGTVNAAVVNNGTFNADFSGQSLILQTSNMSNNSLFEATGSGTLIISGITVTQAAGAQILAGTSSSVFITGSTISGGTLNAASGSSIALTTSNLNAVTIGSGTLAVQQGGTTVNITGGTLVNNGTIQVDTYSSNANLNFNTSTSVTGTGTIFLDDYNPHPTLNSGSGATVTFSAGQVVDGSGTVNAAVVNNGTFNANYSGQSLILQTSPMTNNNIFEATGGGTLIITGNTITQGSAGKIVTDSTSAISIAGGATIVGGTLNGSTGGSITTSTATFNNLTISAGTTVVVANSTTLNIAGGSLVNNGTVLVDQFGGNADLNFNTSTSITGTGTLTLNDYSPNARITSVGTSTVTTAATQTINGVGEIDASLVNNGTVNASLSGHTIFLQTDAMTNNNLFEATGGGTLGINGITVTQSAGAFITAANTSTVSIYGGATIIGGTLNAATGGSVSTSNATFTNITIGTGTTVVAVNSTTLNISGGTLVNNGTIQVDQFGGNADLNFTATTSVTGTGTIMLDDYSPNARLTAASGATVTFGSGQTITGVGEIDPTVTNNGTINANYSGHTIYLNGNTSSSGTVEGTGGGTLDITATLTSLAGSTLSGAITVDTTGHLISAGALLGAASIADNNTIVFNASTGSGILTRTLTALNIGSTGTVTLNLASNHLNRSLLVTSALTFAGYTNNWTGKLDASNNDLDIKGGSIGDISNQIAEGFSGGTWQGSGGIISSAAASNAKHLTTLGSILNGTTYGTAAGSLGTFDGINPAATDVLVKYTYYGDANLDGKVDGSDYTKIDAGFSSHGSLTGWQNGDFNYDSVIDGSDYTLIDNAFNTQTTSLVTAAQFASPTAQFSGSAAVPEPTSLGLAMVATGLTISRRRTRRR